MTTFAFGPTITYVTDPGLSMTEHKRVLREMIRAADGFMVRIAFRLPGTPDEAFYSLLDWYWNEEAKSFQVNGMRAPLVHYRPGFTDRFPETDIWMPSRYLGTRIEATAFSVHTRQEVEHAVEVGASEVIFGHVFATASHPNEQARGIDGLLAAREGLLNTPGLTFTAIGGINEGSMYAMGAKGMMSVACIRAISTSPDIPETLWSMHQAWSRGYMDSLEKGDQQ